jgi:phage tail sheath protein FI
MIMAFQISPGVNVSEVDLTTVVPAVSTTVGGIAGHFSWGPVQQRVLIDNEDTLATQFAKPNANTASDFFTAASFLGYGNSLFVVRVINEAGTTSNARNATSNAANTQNTVIKNEDDYELNYINGVSGVGSWVAKYPGVLGNSLRVSVCSSSNAYQSTLTGTLAFTNNSTTVTGIGTEFTTQIRVGDILLAGPDRVEVKVAAVAGANTLTLQSRYVGNTVASQSSVARRWEFFNFFDAAPGTSEYASIQGGSNDEMHIVVADEDGAWTGRSNNVIERYAAVSKASDALTQDGATNYYTNVINDRSQYIWWTAHQAGMTNTGRPAAGVNFGLGSQARPFNDSLVNGRDGAAPRSADYINGFNKLANPEEVDVSLILTGDGNVTKAVHVINNIAEVRKDCIAVISPRRNDVVNNSTYVGKEVDDSIAFRNLIPSSSYAVLDGGYKYIYDKYNDIYRYVPLNGDTAGLMVRTDNERDPWFSPAGFNRGQVKNVIKLSFNPTKAQRDQLYKNGINPVVTFPGQGTVLFGDKTLLAKPSAFDRINVRRLFIVLEKAISTAAKFTLFEFNDEFTRAQFRNLVEPFLRDVQGRRGIFDFRVVCDETNNTPEVIDRNEFVGDIYVKPARSINFIQLNFVAVRTGVEFTEIVGRA